MAEFLYASNNITKELGMQNLTEVSGGNTWSD